MPSSLLRRRPDIESAEQQLAAADHALGASRDAFMPDIQLAESGGYVGSDAGPQQSDSNLVARRKYSCALLLSAELSLVEVHAGRLSAIVQLYQSLGGGWIPLGYDVRAALTAPFRLQ